MLSCGWNVILRLEGAILRLEGFGFGRSGAWGLGSGVVPPRDKQAASRERCPRETPDLLAVRVILLLLYYSQA